MQLTTDQAFVKMFNGTIWVPNRIVAVHKTGAFNSACAGGIYTAATKGGSAIVAAGQSWANLTTAGKIVTATLAAVATTNYFSGADLFVSLTTGNGAALTADLFVFGHCLDLE